MAYKKNNRGSYVLGEEGNQFTVTKREYNEIQSLVKRANQRRVDNAHRYYDKMSTANVMVGIEYDTYMNLLNEKGFITEKYTTKLSQFNSKDDVKSLLKELKTVTKKGYGSNRVDDVRYKMIEQIQKNYGSSGEPLIDRISELSDGELLSMYLMSDKEIIAELFYPPETHEDYVEDQVNQTLTYIDKLTSGSKSNKLSKATYKKGFKNYKQRQRTKKKKKG